MKLQRRPLLPFKYPGVTENRCFGSAPSALRASSLDHNVTPPLQDASSITMLKNTRRGAIGWGVSNKHFPPGGRCSRRWDVFYVGILHGLVMLSPTTMPFFSPRQNQSKCFLLHSTLERVLYIFFHNVNHAPFAQKVTLPSTRRVHRGLFLSPVRLTPAVMYHATHTGTHTH